MLFKNVNRFKPLYKQFVALKENIQNRTKVLRFEKKKWIKFVESYTQKLKRYRKFKPKDQVRYIVSRYSSKGSSYKARTKNNLRALKKFKLFYGGMPRSHLKSLTRSRFRNTCKKVRSFFWEFFERRLDTVLYRSKFATSMRHARQLILHGKIVVNHKLVKTKSYFLNPGDLITISVFDFNTIQTNIKQSFKWPVPPKYLVINYRTLQIVFGPLRYTNLSLNFFHYLNAERILNSRHLR